MHKFIAISLLLLSSLGIAGDLGNQFVTTKLAYGTSISLPRSWQVRRGDEMAGIDTAVAAAADLSGYSKMIKGTEILLFSSFPDTALYGSVTVTSTTMPGVTPSFPSSLSAIQVGLGESMVRQAIETTQAKFGANIFGWTPLRKVVLGNKVAVYTSYLRTSGSEKRRVHMYKFFGSGRIFDLALSTNVTAEDVNGVVLEMIAGSFVVP